jgi:cardiolipin synthase
MELLKKKALEGVTVRLLYDKFGSTQALFSGLFHKYRNIPNFKICGWTQANPLKRQFQINLRNHRKIAIIDGKVAFTGGMNILALHASTEGKPPEIRDYHFLLEGLIAQELQYSFLKDWYFMTEENPDILLQPAHFPGIANKGNAMIRVVNSGPTPDEMETIGKIFFESMMAARKEVIAVTPYFVPPAEIMEAFFSCTRRGVEVKLLLPQENNHFYAGLAGRALYEDLLKSGIRIFERHPPFMHSKALLIDDKIAIVGSANIDIRSIRLNYETNLVVFDSDGISKIKEVVQKEFMEATELSLKKWQQRSISQQFLENFFHLFASML